MKVTVNSLKDLYVSLGGQLTDTFEDIAGGVPVADYTTIPDVIEACSQIAGSTIELPAVSGADDGKVLKVIDGKWSKGTDESLPAVTAEDAGKILGVTEQGKWAPETAPTELPAVSASDNGTLLSVVDGAWAKGLKLKRGEANFSTGTGTISQLNFELWKGFGDVLSKKFLVSCHLSYEDISSHIGQDKTVTYIPYNKTLQGQTYQNVLVRGVELQPNTQFEESRTYKLIYYYFEEA